MSFINPCFKLFKAEDSVDYLPNHLLLTHSQTPFFLLISYFFLQIPSQLSNPGRMTARAGRRSSHHWQAVWFLSLRCHLRKMARKRKERQDKKPLPPLVALTITCLLDVSSTLAHTVLNDSSSRTLMPLRQPKPRGTAERC